MNDVKLGTTPTEEAKRDAIHIAVAPVVAGEWLNVGASVEIRDGKAFNVCPHNKGVGIVDPFRSSHVNNGERFWLCLHQGTIVGMRHHWSHPAFVDHDPKEASIAWLTLAAQKAGVSYEEMMGYVESGDYINMGMNENYKDIDYDDFERHVEIVTGKKDCYPPFTCSC